ncbi:MAG: DNA polymerase III subunit gamma/tau [Acholeplasmatales bacterium]|nr:DNA polymerase III subunit gamma/tau [Acholeplasmatales bacterium]
MAYVALYRAYRPQKFSEVVGQQHIIKTLQNAIKMNKVAHAYLFCGPRGTGKTTLAKIMAKAMNCENGPTIEPCCECEMCKGITQGMISDVVEIDAASNNGADDIRALRETAKFLPSQGKYKVYIIDEVHMLSVQAFNALLKTLEEPPAHVIFILCTTEPHKLLSTILSRCQRFDFQTISIEDMLKRLRIVADEENIKITDEALYQIAQSAEGGMRDALSLFDQCISYSVNPEITLDDVLAVSGNISYLKLIDLIGYAYNGDSIKCIELANSMVDEGKEVPRILNDLILFLRDTLMYKNKAVIVDKLMYQNENFKNVAGLITKSAIYKWVDILNDSLNQMKFSTQKRAYLELAILKMSDVQIIEEANITERIESLEHSVEELYKRPNQVQVEVKTEKKEPIFKSSEEINNLRVEPIHKEEKTAQVEEKIDYPDEINIHDIENILYSATKQDKEKLQKIWNDIAIKYADIVDFQILVRGKICAASSTSFLVEFADMGFCNRIMKYENYVKIMEVLSEYSDTLNDYICITHDTWSKIALDYKNKYSKDNLKPKLENIRINVKRRVVPTTIVKNEEDTLIDAAKELLGDNIEIMEDK